VKFSDLLKTDDLTPDELYEKRHVVWCNIVDIVFEDEEEDLSQLSPEGQVYYLLNCLRAEIRNGGFNQLYFNSLSDHIPEILRHLEAIGARKTHGLLMEANSFFPRSQPSINRQRRQKQLEKLEKKNKLFMEEIYKLDRLFWDSEELDDLLWKFIEKNAAVKFSA